MTKDEILKQAFIKYPVGTEVISLGGAGKEIINKPSPKFYLYQDNNLRHDENMLLYRDGMFAEVVSKSGIINNYETY